MEYKYSGRNYAIRLNDEGKIECAEMDIVADTVDEVKTRIRENITIEKAAPRINVLVYENRRKGDGVYLSGTTSGKLEGGYYKQAWISWKDEKGKSQRQKEPVYRIYMDTLENRLILDTVIDLRSQAAQLESEAAKLMGTLETLASKTDQDDED